MKALDLFAVVLLTCFFAVAGAVALIVVMGGLVMLFQRGLFVGAVTLAFGGAWVVLIVTVERHPKPREHDD